MAEPVPPLSAQTPLRAERRRITVNAIILVLATGAVACAALLGLRMRGEQSSDADRSAALAAARHLTVSLTSISSTTATADINAVLSGSTGAFREQFSSERSSYLSAVKAADVTSRGVVAAAGVVSSRPGQVVVLVAGSAIVKGARTASAAKRSFRMRLTLVKASSRWLVSKIQLVA